MKQTHERPMSTFTRFRMVWIALFLLVTAFSTTARQEEQQEEDKPPPDSAELGEEVPPFTLPDEQGRERSLSEYEGRIIVLEWTDTQCPIVQQQYSAGNVQETYSSVKKLDSGVVWLAINSTAGSTPKQNEFWKRRYGLEWPILIDKGGVVAQKYGVRRVPHMFVIDKEGVLRYHGALHNDQPPGKQPPGKATNYVVESVRNLVEGGVVSPDHVGPWGCFAKYGQ